MNPGLRFSSLHALAAGLDSAQPGTPGFRAAPRKALEGMRDGVTAEAVFTLSAADDNGVDSRSQGRVRIGNGGWKPVK